MNRENLNLSIVLEIDGNDSITYVVRPGEDGMLGMSINTGISRHWEIGMERCIAALLGESAVGSSRHRPVERHIVRISATEIVRFLRAVLWKEQLVVNEEGALRIMMDSSYDTLSKPSAPMQDSFPTGITLDYFREISEEDVRKYFIFTRRNGVEPAAYLSGFTDGRHDGAPVPILKSDVPDILKTLLETEQLPIQPIMT